MSADESQIVSGAHDNSVRIWDIRNGKSIGKPFLGHTESVLSKSMSEDGEKIISGSIHRIVIVWNVQEGIREGQPLRGHTNQTDHVEISGDGRIAASGSSDGTVRAWNTRENETLRQGDIENENGLRKGVMIRNGNPYVFKTG